MTQFSNYFFFNLFLFCFSTYVSNVEVLHASYGGNVYNTSILHICIIKSVFIIIIQTITNISDIQTFASRYWTHTVLSSFFLFFAKEGQKNFCTIHNKKKHKIFFLFCRIFIYYTTIAITSSLLHIMSYIHTIRM